MPSIVERALFHRWRAQALWKWRSYASQDRAIISRLIEAGVPIETIWDVGASNGGWSWILGCNIPTIRHHLFKPLAGHVETMQKRFSSSILASQLDAAHVPDWRAR
jgi:hypothetical protein